MNLDYRAIGRILLTVALLAAVGRASAAPALKDRPGDASVDLSAVHQWIEKAQTGTSFAETDLRRVKDTLVKLLAKLDTLENRTGLPAKGRKMPAAFDQARTAEVAETVGITQKQQVLAVGRTGRLTQSSFSVLLVSGDAEVVQSQNCVIIAGGNVKLIQSSGCVVVAGKSVEMTQCFPRKNNKAPPAGDEAVEPAVSVVVAGERLKCVQSKVGLALVLRPLKSDDGPAIRSIQCRDLVFLNSPTDWKSTQDTDCRTDQLKAPFAK